MRALPGVGLNRTLFMHPDQYPGFGMIDVAGYGWDIVNCNGSYGGNGCPGGGTASGINGYTNLATGFSIKTPIRRTVHRDRRPKTQTAHAAMNVGIGDGSVRSYRGSMSVTTWVQAGTPNDGASLGGIGTSSSFEERSERMQGRSEAFQADFQRQKADLRDLRHFFRPLLSLARGKSPLMSFGVDFMCQMVRFGGVSYTLAGWVFLGMSFCLGAGCGGGRPAVQLVPVEGQNRPQQ